MEFKYLIEVKVKELNYSKVFEVEAERVGLAQTRAISLATDGDLHLSGQLVEYEVKELIVNDLGCKYRWNSEYKELEFSNMLSDGSFEDEWNLVEPELVGEEEVTFHGKTMTLYEVYSIVKRELKVA